MNAQVGCEVSDVAVDLSSRGNKSSRVDRTTVVEKEEEQQREAKQKHEVHLLSCLSWSSVSPLLSSARVDKMNHACVFMYIHNNILCLSMYEYEYL